MTEVRGRRLFGWTPTPGAFPPVGVMVAASVLVFVVRRLEVASRSGPAGVVVWLVDLAYILLPLYFVVAQGGKDKATLGLTSRRLTRSAVTGLALGVLLGAAQMRQLSAAGRQIGFVLSAAWVAWIVSLVYHVFAEEMLYRAWLQEALIPALGVVPGIMAAAALYGLAPLALLGSDPSLPADWQTPIGFLTRGFPSVMTVGLLLNVVYFLTHNIVASTLASVAALLPLGLVAGGSSATINPWAALALLAVLIAAAVLGSARLVAPRRRSGAGPQPGSVAARLGG